MSPRRAGGRWILGPLLAGSLITLPAFADSDRLPADYPASLERELAATLGDLAARGEVVDALLRAADLYAQIADDLFHDDADKRRAFEAGAAMAQRALLVDERNAQAHFLYAMTLGSAERLKGMTNAGLALRDINKHLRRALELDPSHAPALQMMGGLYAELPWILGGSDDEAERHLRRAIAADGRYTNARVLLAKLLIKHAKADEAKQQLLAVLAEPRPHYPYSWRHRFKPEAEQLLRTLPSPP